MRTDPSHSPATAGRRQRAAVLVVIALVAVALLAFGGDEAGNVAWHLLRNLLRHLF